jgi:PIN domain nuclease of toxin-antitoxin system
VLGGGLDWDHRDPFDRTIAATALVEGYPLITADPVFETLNGLTVMW